MRWFVFVLLIASAFSSGSAQEKTGEIALREVKYDALKDVVLKYRGKVVLVDFWFNT